MFRFLLSLLVTTTPLWGAPDEMSVPGEIVPKLQARDETVLVRFLHDEITHITFHHEGFAGNDAALFARASAARDKQTISQRVRNINHFHTNSVHLGMIAYHYAVDKKGNIAKARPVKYKPATRSTVWGGSTLADFNGHFAVVALGDFNHETLTPAGRLALVQVMSAAQRAYHVPTHRIQPHRAHANSSCPGETLLAEADELARMVSLYSLQRELALRGCGDVVADGVDGPATQAAVQKLRAAYETKEFAISGSDAFLMRLLKEPSMKCR